MRKKTIRPIDNILGKSNKRDRLSALLRNIAAKASTFYERIDCRYVPDQDAINEGIINERLFLWKTNLSGGNENLFNKRLLWDGISEKSACAVLAPGEFKSPVADSPWVMILRECLIAIRNFKYKDAFEAERNKEKSFEEIMRVLFLPVSRYAKDTVVLKCPDSVNLLSDRAWEDLECYLTDRLIMISSSALELEFTLFSRASDTSLTTMIKRINGTLHKDFEKFLIHIVSDGAESFFEEYAVLARLIAVTVQQWTETTVELLERFIKDSTDLETFFFNNAQLDIIERIITGISDLHNNGRSVMQLYFRDGKKIVYKPKDVNIEEIFFRLIEWINACWNMPKMQAMKVLERRGYGWVEYAEHKPCLNEEEVRRYYVRSGMLLFLFYILEGTDIHYENVIACGEFPVIIDLETIFHHQYVSHYDREDISAQNLAGKRVWRSVLRTMLLPNWIADYDGNRFNVSGLSMESLRENDTGGMKGNMPVKDGNIATAESYMGEIEKGFRLMADMFIKNKKSLTEKDSPVYWFAGAKVRFILRPTKVYSQMIRRLLFHKYLRDGIDMSIQIDTLSQSFMYSNEKPLECPVVKNEHQVLSALNVPFYYAYSSKTDLHLDSDETIANYFAESSHERTLKNITLLDNAEVETQIQFIHNSFHSFRALSTHSAPRADDTLHTMNLESDLVSEDRFYSEAVKIAKNLIQTRIVSTDGSSTWIGMHFMPQINRYEFQVIDHSFYVGNAGIAFFFACLSKITGDGLYSEACRSALKTIRERLCRDPHRYARVLGLGGFHGIPSIAYALFCSGEILKDDSMIEDARRTLSGITEEQIERDKYYDMLLGSAGTLMVILKVISHFNDKNLVKIAHACGKRILESLPGKEGTLENRSIWNDFPRTGFSHGASGVSLALLKLYHKTEQRKYLDTSRILMDYENAFWNEKMQNWLDGNSEKTFFSRAWCHGGPGIALGRLCSLRYSDDKTLKYDIERAIQKGVSESLSQVDNLCCGNLGRALIFYEAGNLLNNTMYSSVATKMTKQVIKKADRHGGAYNLVADLPETVCNPSLMQGLAGVGYALLYMNKKKYSELPFVLSLE